VDHLVAKKGSCRCDAGLPLPRVGPQGGDVGCGGVSKRILIRLLGNLGVDVGLAGGGTDGVHATRVGRHKRLHALHHLLVAFSGGSDETILGGDTGVVGGAAVGGRGADVRLGGEQGGSLDGLRILDGFDVCLPSLAAGVGLRGSYVGEGSWQDGLPASAEVVLEGSLRGGTGAVRSGPQSCSMSLSVRL